MDIGGDVETCRIRTRLAENQNAGTCHLGGTEGGQETTGGDGGRGCGKTAEQGSPVPPQSMEKYVGVVQSGGGSRPAALLNHAQADHGGASGTLPRRTPPGSEYPQICTALPN